MDKTQVLTCLLKAGLSWKDFENFMVGKTISQDGHGNDIYWAHDVKDYLVSRLGKEGYLQVFGRSEESQSVYKDTTMRFIKWLNEEGNEYFYNTKYQKTLTHEELYDIFIDEEIKSKQP